MQIDTVWHTGDLVNIGVLGVMSLGYLLSRRADVQSRQEARDLQTQRHTENTEKLNHLSEFKTAQENTNRQRDEQVVLLSNMASASAEALKGFNRRLELVENETRDNRRKN
jgi:hypothetical protein